MGAMPKKMIAGTAIGFIGGIIAIAAMSFAWNGTLDSATIVGIDMLLAVGFFGVAGAFTSHSPVRGNTVLVLSVICEAIVFAAMYYEAVTLWTGIVLAILGLANIAIGACPTVRGWVDTNRFA